MIAIDSVKPEFIGANGRRDSSKIIAFIKMKKADGISMAAACRMVGISQTVVSRWMQKRTGEWAARRKSVACLQEIRSKVQAAINAVEVANATLVICDLKCFFPEHRRNVQALLNEFQAVAAKLQEVAK